jgi:hypothetical protein
VGRLAGSVDTGHSALVTGGPFAREEVEWTRAQLEAGRPIADVVRFLLDDKCGPSAVVRSLVEGADLPIESATELVAAGVGAAAAVCFLDLWDGARVRCGSSADDAVSAFGDLLTEHGEVTTTDLDLWDAVEVIGVDRLRRMGVNDDSIRWFRSALMHHGRGSEQVVLHAIDRLHCPAALVPDLLDVARAADASRCRWPIAVIVRSHGGEQVASERDRLAESHLPDDRQVADKWSYWLRADWDLQ